MLNLTFSVLCLDAWGATRIGKKLAEIGKLYRQESGLNPVLAATDE